MAMTSSLPRLIATTVAIICTNIEFAIASNTFVATSHQNLELRPLPEELSVNSIDDVVGRTKLFASLYNASIVSSSERFDINGNEVTDYPKTETKPDILLVRGSPVPEGGSIKSSPYGFISAATTAYGHHVNLVIRPDDIWITILSQFAFYVNARAEQLRDVFVDHDGQEELVVTVGGANVRTAPYDEMTRTFLDVISSNINDPSLREWFLPGFTTTTPTDEVVASATAMCTFQEYFTYTYSILCGIPYVTLDGTVEDWLSLERKIQRLLEFDDGTDVINEWVDLLNIVIKNFIESAKNGSVNNLEFWDNILYENSMGYGTPMLSGWITTFSFFGEKGQKLGYYSNIDYDGMEPPPRKTFLTVDRGLMNANILSCPAKIDDNGKEYNATLFVGQMSYEYNDGQTSGCGGSDNQHQHMQIIPRNDWALIVQEGTIELQRPDSNTLGLPEYPHRDVEMCAWFDHLELPDDGYAAFDFPPKTSADERGSSSLCDERVDPSASTTSAAMQSPTSSTYLHHIFFASIGFALLFV